MSAILGVFDPDGQIPDDDVVRRMLGSMAARGSERSGIWRGDGAVLAVARNGWQTDAYLAGPALPVEEDGVVAVADAAIYYRDDLRRKLAGRGVHPSAHTPTHLILAAYRAWGERCAEHLEGDFAFLIWDSRTRTVLGARDFQGKRKLFWTEAGPALVVASGIGALTAHPHRAAELNLAAVGALAAGFFSAGSETCYQGVSSLQAGTNLVRRNGAVRIERHWSPPPIDGGSTVPFDEAAEELRRLLCRAVEERLAPTGPTAVWLSGGWDSTAVFGAGEAVLRERGRGEHLHAVSISYPPGDPGREDELIEAVVGQWGGPISWLDIADIPLLDRPAERATVRDEPFAHTFEMWNRALARVSREVGARVALDGNGGDQFFQVSNIYMGDLFRTGRWLTLAREWSAKGGQVPHFRGLFRNAVQPNLSDPLLRLARVLRRGRPLRWYLEPVVPDWFDPDFLARTDLVGRERRNNPARREREHAAQEMYWYLSNEFAPRVISTVYDFALEAGVEDRSPLYDRRVVEFAAGRPRWERSSGHEIKRLLRRSMHGLLPEHVLAPRPHKTGTTFGYFAKQFRGTHGAFVSAILREPLVLEELGIVRAATLRKRCDDYLKKGYVNLGGGLFGTLQVEFWLRAQLNPQPRTGLEPVMVPDAEPAAR